MPILYLVPSDYTDILTSAICHHVSLKAISFFFFLTMLSCHGCEKCLFHRTHTIYDDDSFIRLSFLSSHAIKESVSMPEK